MRVGFCVEGGIDDKWLHNPIICPTAFACLFISLIQMSDKIESTLQVLTEANELLAAHAALILRVRSAQQIHRLELKELDSPPVELLKLPLIPSSPVTPEEEEEQSLSSSPPPQNALRTDLNPSKRARAARYVNYVPEEETIRNDYSQRYVDGGEWPQNWVLGAELQHRFEEYYFFCHPYLSFADLMRRYPKQKRLLDLKKVSVNQYALQPMYLPFSDFSTLHPSKFDVILLDPPFSSTFTWDQLQELSVPSLASDPSFVFLWVGSGAGEGLERGREILAKWGYRRCEDIVWIKTNNETNQGPGASRIHTSSKFQTSHIITFYTRQIHPQPPYLPERNNIVLWASEELSDGRQIIGLFIAMLVSDLCCDCYPLFNSC